MVRCIETIHSRHGIDLIFKKKKSGQLNEYITTNCGRMIGKSDSLINFIDLNDN